MYEYERRAARSRRIRSKRLVRTFRRRRVFTRRRGFAPLWMRLHYWRRQPALYGERLRREGGRIIGCAGS